MITSLQGPFRSKINNARMLAESGLEDKLREVFRHIPINKRLWIYGDKAYTAKFGIIRAYKRQRRDRELRINHTRYNETISSMRITVENSFAGVSNL